MAARKAAWKQGRLAECGKKVVGEAGFAGGARAGVQGDPAGRQVVGGQDSVRVQHVVVAVENHSDGRQRRSRKRGRCGQPRRLKAQRRSSWSTWGRPVRARAVRVWAVSWAQAQKLPRAACWSAKVMSSGSASAQTGWNSGIELTPVSWSA